ncbi:MAG: hypothetical protein AABW81_02005 [Nanoarchaeota archaeon]
MVKVIDLCTSCVQVITNPLCPHCFSNHVRAWLRDKNLPKEKMREIEKSLKKLVFEADSTPSDLKCVICGANKVNLCLYCVTNKVHRILEKDTAKKVTKEFDEDFNTQIWRI